MKLPFALASGKIPAVLLACLLIAACSNMQKGGSGSGSQEAAPISEAEKPQPGATPGSPSGSSATSPSAAAPATNAGASPGTRSSAAPAPGDEEAQRLQQQLSEQEAQINKLHDEQVNAQRLAEEEAARQRAAESAAAGGTTAQDRPAEPSSSAQSSAAAAAAAAAGTGSQAAEAGDPSQPNGHPVADQPLQRSIYFKYDDATIGDEYDSVLIAHAAFLKAHPDYKAEVQGNCDDRGSREYNIALGARRAEAVKRGLELAGVDGGRIKAISYGAEKPVAFGQDEESYKKNRRADILY